MNQIVYFGDKSLLFTTPSGLQNLPHMPSTIYIKGHEVERAKVTEIFEKNNSIVVECDNIEACVAKFAADFKNVVAAGGVVESPNGDVLMIRRLGRWDLPKGHHEEGETLEQCAVREVQEECGVGELTLGRKVGETQHIYNKKGVWELKTTHWWAMSSPSNVPLTPQQEEGIERAEWIPKEGIEEHCHESYPTIKDILAAYLHA